MGPEGSLRGPASPHSGVGECRILAPVEPPVLSPTQCVAGYHGVNCSEEINECLSHPCQNGGTCLDLPNTYKCSCPRGTQGKGHCMEGWHLGGQGQGGGRAGTPRSARGIQEPPRNSIFL
ncbi:hypothetical protein P7K49_002091 [Saguinus oedipus]|uniref:EGF-like domain-containing protein n=1 Tax=Saguinus oedipus TaxID=9490 RepID=A0ABQ9WGX9_SAGOE|nr:hypothetical protein P7K49_002091 [Saguinus oedipus]